MKGVRYTPYEHQSLNKAVWEGRIEIVREVIRSRSLNHSQQWLKASDGYELLCTAIKKKHTEIAKLLLTNGSRVNSASEYSSETPLHFAVRNGDIEIVQMLLHKGANIEAKNIIGYTPFHLALRCKKIEIIYILLNWGASVEPTSRHGIIPMHVATDIGSKKVINLLLSEGANVNVKNAGGKTALHIATDRGYSRIVERLLTHGAYVNACDDQDGYTPLHVAAENGSEEIIKLLLKNGANVNAEAKDGTTSLHLATQMAELKIVEHLLKCGANVNGVYSSKYVEGYTLLHQAADNGLLDIIELLLKFGASVNATDKYGMTALHIASMYNRKEIVMALLEHGSDSTIMSKKNYTALDFAKAFDIVKILKRHMVKIKAANLNAVNKDILSISSPTFGSDDEELSDFQNECEKEIASLKSEVINGNITLYDILTGSVRLLARYATNECIVKAFGSDNYKKKFPTYAGMIDRNFRKGQKEKEFMEKGDKIFGFLFNNNFPLLPRECIEKILSYLNYEDLI